MSISVEVSNLGPLRSAKADLADLTLLVGENNTGKTFFATVLHRVLGASPVSPSMAPSYRSQRKPIGKIPPQVRDWLRGHNADPTSDTSLPASPWLLPQEDTSEWATAFATSSLSLFGADVRSNIEYAFGVEASELRRRTPQPSCFRLLPEDT